MTTALIINLGSQEDALVRQALATVGCEQVLAAAAGTVPVIPLHGHSPDLVVVHLIAGNPREPQRLHRLCKSLADTPVVAICEEPMVEDALRSGAADAVCLPLRWAELVARLRAALCGRADKHRRRTREIRTHETLERLQRENTQLERLVSVDALTGIANRRHTLAMLDAEWRRSARAHASIALVMVDLDFFHAYNEQYGHLGGDACLRRVSGAMVTSLRRPSDFIGRYGGEEFVAVLPGTDARGAQEVAERLRAAVEGLAIPHTGSTCAPHVTITAGFAALTVTGEASPEVLIAAADEALLRAKRMGRNRIEGEGLVSVPLAAATPAPRSPTRFPPVFADPWFADRIPAFLAEVRAEAESLDLALRDGRIDRVRTFARRLRALGHALGLAEVERHGDALDHHLRSHDDTAARGTLALLLQYVASVQVVYRRTADAASARAAT